MYNSSSYREHNNSTYLHFNRSINLHFLFSLHHITRLQFPFDVKVAAYHKLKKKNCRYSYECSQPSMIHDFFPASICFVCSALESVNFHKTRSPCGAQFINMPIVGASMIPLGAAGCCCCRCCYTQTNRPARIIILYFVNYLSCPDGDGRTMRTHRDSIFYHESRSAVYAYCVAVATSSAVAAKKDHKKCMERGKSTYNNNEMKNADDGMRKPRC